jgi:non-ribosomal peptide synthetase component E (peptide arylation enzyme)
VVDGLPAHRKGNVREYMQFTKGKLIDQQLHDVHKNRQLVRSLFDTPSVVHISDC